MVKRSIIGSIGLKNSKLRNIPNRSPISRNSTDLARPMQMHWLCTYFKGLEPKTRATMKAIFSAITETNKDLELVMAWNQPMLRMGKTYVLGASLSKNHLTLNTFSTDVLEKHLKKLSGYEVNKHTFVVPLDWKVDGPLLRSMAKARISEIKK